MAHLSSMVVTLAVAQLCAALCIAAGLFLWRTLR
jgi:hypothetical protein